MQVTTAREARNRFGQLLDRAQRRPVAISKNGRAVTVMLSVAQYERLRDAAMAQLASTMDTMSAEAANNGLTDATLEALLADES
ncbi:MAG: type II toxin-antitoxin system Phd/YefM family antitoxin [Gammaproteobacteria bacterium]|nr:type II toxin-antitoxin system Phd/YefM family antitoxin [Gammaproteobacteria bacterium]MXY53423.1 type II toxin-antitoxin system Phd/YefM family antitoxin [Gammaproteobacteria bacterium]